jgi:hypothetical protein
MRIKGGQYFFPIDLMTESLHKGVYLGRGPGCYRQPGNKEYRGLVKLYAADFHRDATRAEKSKFVDNLQAKFEMQGFRFFCYSKKKQMWVNALEWEIKEKIGHDLRDNRKSLASSKDKFRLSKGTAKKSSTLTKALVLDTKRNHVMQNYSIRNNGFEAYPSFQLGSTKECIKEASLLHQLHYHTKYVMIPTAGLEEFQKFDLNDMTNELWDEFTMENKEVNTLTTSIASDKESSKSPNPVFHVAPNDMIEGKQIFISNGFHEVTNV